MEEERAGDFQRSPGQFEGALVTKPEPLGFRDGVGRSWRIWFVRRFEKQREGLALLCKELAGITEGEDTGVVEGYWEFLGAGEELLVVSPFPTRGEEGEVS